MSNYSLAGWILLLPAAVAFAWHCAAQTFTLDPIGVRPAVTITDAGGPPSASVKLFKNGTSVGLFSTTAFGLFSIPNISAASNDLFYVTASRVWHFNSNGNSEGWSGSPGDGFVVTGGVWRQTNSTGSDMAVAIYGDGLIKTGARVLEVRLRYQRAASAPASVQVQSPGPKGVAGGDDDGLSWILNTVTLQPSTAFQTLRFDLGIDHNGATPCWLDGAPPITINLYIPGVAAGNLFRWMASSSSTVTMRIG